MEVDTRDVRGRLGVCDGVEEGITYKMAIKTASFNGH